MIIFIISIITIYIIIYSSLASITFSLFFHPYSELSKNQSLHRFMESYFMAREKPIYRETFNTTYDYEATRYNNDDDGGKKADNTPLTLLDIDKKVR